MLRAKYITIDELRKGLSRETSDNVVDNGNIYLIQLQVIWDGL